MILTSRPLTHDEATALLGADVQFVRGVKTPRGLPLKAGERGRVVGVRDLPDRALLVVDVVDVGEVIVGNLNVVEPLNGQAR
jgi:hypothetical protein